VANGLDGDVDRYLLDVDRQLQPYLEQAVQRIPEVDGLKEGVSFQVMGGGKRIRAALCTTVCEIFCGSSEPALNFAAAIEHLQNFSLVHDDIADGDHERRGRESAWRRFGVAHAINIGDVFIPLSALAILEAAYTAQTKVALLRVLSELGLLVTEGQGLDINLRRNDAPTPEDYVACTRKKTGAFFAMAAVGGGIIGGAEPRDLERLRAFALQAGVAFQIRDDALDVIGGKGRPMGSDVLEGKRTLMVAYAAERSAPRDRARLFEILNRPRERTTPQEVAWVHELFRRTRARERADETANLLIDDAVEQIAELPETAAKYRFIRLSKYLMQRIR
jgi:geranylgeranyl diphosphate synthase type I